jgi:hypothetical protein
MRKQHDEISPRLEFNRSEPDEGRNRYENSPPCGPHTHMARCIMTAPCPKTAPFSNLLVQAASRAAV